MKVERWGKWLAVRLPQELVDALGLKEGDDVKLTAKGQSVTSKTRRQDAPANVTRQGKPPALDVKE
ncbi:MAG TPA: AbrB/MazE/SpoVT family DNA-binding domain-containing protein [Beijerinckiaceae bacterium]|jgi:antitoxin MazE